MRIGSRSAEPRFDWQDTATWSPALNGVRSVYVSYHPDLAVPGAVETVGAFAELAVQSGASRLVLLTARGEPEAVLAEQAVRASAAELTILQSSWFMQNFSEDFLLEHVRSGELALPAGKTPEPFVDADDIADVAVAAPTEDGHAGQLYELTGPRLVTFSEAADEIANASGREIRYLPVSLEQHAAAAADQGVPPEFVELMTYMCSATSWTAATPTWRTASSVPSAGSRETSPTTPATPPRPAYGTR